MEIIINMEATAALTKPVKKLPKRDPNDYHWYKCAKGRAHFGDHHKDHEVTITPGDVFGLKFYRGKYFLIDKSDMTMQFGLIKDEGVKLIKNSEPFAGKIAGKKVTPGATHSEVKAGGVAKKAGEKKLTAAEKRKQTADDLAEKRRNTAPSPAAKKASDTHQQKEKDEEAAATKALKSLKGTHWLTASNAMDKITGTKSKSKVKELVTDVLVKISLDTSSKNRDMLEHDFVSNSPEMKEFLADFSPKQTWSQVTNNVMNLRKKFKGKKVKPGDHADEQKEKEKKKKMQDALKKERQHGAVNVTNKSSVALNNMLRALNARKRKSGSVVPVTLTDKIEKVKAAIEKAPATPAKKTSSTRTPVAGKTKEELQKSLSELMKRKRERRLGPKDQASIDKLKSAIARLAEKEEKDKEKKGKEASKRAEVRKAERAARPQKEKDEEAAATKAVKHLRGTHGDTAYQAMSKITGTKSKAKVKALVTDLLVEISLDTYSKNRDMLEHDLVSNSPEMKEFLADFSTDQTEDQVTINVMNLRKKFKGKKGVSHTPAATDASDDLETIMDSKSHAVTALEYVNSDYKAKRTRKRTLEKAKNQTLSNAREQKALEPQIEKLKESVEKLKVEIKKYDLALKKAKK
jgi:hypothetical protein